MKSGKDRLGKFIDGKMNQNDMDTYMQNLLVDKFDKRIRQQYEKELANKYDVRKKSSGRTISIYKWLSYAAVFVLVLGAVFIFNTIEKELPIDKRAMAYLNENPLDYNGTIRGTEENDLPFKLFQEGKYSKAIVAWGTKAETSVLTNEENTFYCYALIQESKFDQAHRLADQSLSTMKSEDDWFSELAVYNILALCLDNKQEQAHSKFESLDEGSWEEQQLKYIFE